MMSYATIHSDIREAVDFVHLKVNLIDYVVNNHDYVLKALFVVYFLTRSM